jgi:pyruvate/2-oxoglutarate dehydrogenase complex dihydrolipoamide acyltransferase (E2) component
MVATIASHLQGTIVNLLVEDGAMVRDGSVVALIESMKMHHEVLSPCDGIVSFHVREGATLMAGDAIGEVDDSLVSAATDARTDGAGTADEVPIGLARPDLAEVIERHRIGRDEARPDAVGKRRARRRRTARENVGDLVDEGTFVEYGPVVIAAQRRRRTIDDLIRNTPGDGLVAGIGDVNSALFEGRTTKCVAMSYDYTVLAGTQGLQNHRKKDKLFEVAERLRTPIVFFTEGGGGRPGDTDGAGVGGLGIATFSPCPSLRRPMIGIKNNRPMTRPGTTIAPITSPVSPWKNFKN